MFCIQCEPVVYTPSLDNDMFISGIFDPFLEKITLCLLLTERA